MAGRGVPSGSEFTTILGITSRAEETARYSPAAGATLASPFYEGARGGSSTASRRTAGLSPDVPGGLQYFAQHYTEYGQRSGGVDRDREKRAQAIARRRRIEGLTGLRRELARGGLATEVPDATSSIYRRRSQELPHISPRAGCLGAATASRSNGTSSGGSHKRGSGSGGHARGNTGLEADVCDPTNRADAGWERGYGRRGGRGGRRTAAQWLRDNNCSCKRASLLGRRDLRFENAVIEEDFRWYAWDANRWQRVFLCSLAILFEVARAVIFDRSAGASAGVASSYLVVCGVVALLLSVALVPTRNELCHLAIAAWPFAALAAIATWLGSIVVLDCGLGCVDAGIAAVADTRSLQCLSIDANVVPWTAAVQATALPFLLASTVTDWRVSLALGIASPFVFSSIALYSVATTQPVLAVGLAVLVNSMAPVCVAYWFEENMRNTFSLGQELLIRRSQQRHLRLERDNLASLSDLYQTRATLGRRSDAMLTYLIQQLGSQLPYASGAASQLEASEELSFESRAALARCIAALDTSSNLLEDVQKLASVESLSNKATPRRLNVRKTIAKVAKAAQPRSSGARILYAVDDAVPVYMVHDASLFEQLLEASIKCALRRGGNGASAPTYVSVFASLAGRPGGSMAYDGMSTPMVATGTYLTPNPLSPTMQSETPHAALDSTLQFSIVDDGAALTAADVAMFGADTKLARQVAEIAETPRSQARWHRLGAGATPTPEHTNSESEAIALITRSSAHAVGLALCNRLVGSMGGAFGAHSRDEIDRGAVVWARVPLRAKSADADLQSNPGVSRPPVASPDPEVVDTLWRSARDSRRNVGAEQILEADSIGVPPPDTPVHRERDSFDSSDLTDASISGGAGDEQFGVVFTEYSPRSVASAGAYRVPATGLDADASNSSPRGLHILSLTPLSVRSGTPRSTARGAGNGSGASHHTLPLGSSSTPSPGHHTDSPSARRGSARSGSSRDSPSREATAATTGSAPAGSSSRTRDDGA